MSIASDISDLKDLSDGVVANKVSRFAYTEQAYTDNNADGVTVYDVNNDQNIPVGTASVMKVNQTVIEKGWRARASSITRMLMNHFLGRTSYNLNKVNDWFNDLLVSISSYLGTADGIATLDSNGRLIQQSPVGSPYVPMTRAFLGAVFGRYVGRAWKTVDGFLGTVRLIYYANGLWLVNRYEGKTYKMYWSEDCNSFTLISDLPNLNCVYCSGSFWVGGSGSSTSGCMWWSEDGKNWTQGIQLSELAEGMAPESIYYANGLWVCGTNKGIILSTDGKNWRRSTGMTTGLVEHVYYANGLWVCMPYEKSIWWSTDGDTWTQGTGINSSYLVNTVFYAEGIWVCGTEYNGVWWSTNGKAWTQGTGYTNMVYVVTYANGVWVLGTGIGDKGAWYSTDGKAWTQCNGLGNPWDVTDIRYANETWVSVGNYIWWSDDGKNWFRIPISSAGAYGILAQGHGVWLCNGGTGLVKADIDTAIEAGLIDLGADIPIVNS